MVVIKKRHPPRWIQHQRSHLGCKDFDTSVEAPSCHSYICKGNTSARAAVINMCTLNVYYCFTGKNHEQDLPIQGELGELYSIARYDPAWTSRRTFSSRWPVPWALARWRTFSGSPSLSLSLPTACRYSFNYKHRNSTQDQTSCCPWGQFPPFFTTPSHQEHYCHLWPLLLFYLEQKYDIATHVPEIHVHTSLF